MLGKLGGMAKKLLPDELWAEIAPLIPPTRARPKGGRPPVPARDALLGILFVLATGISWERLPFEVAGCSGMTCWRRLRAWQTAGVWETLHRRLLDKLNLAGRIDWSRASVDSSSVPAKGGRQGRPEPGRPRQAGQQAPPSGRPRRPPSRRPSDRGQPSRQQGAERPRRCRAARPPEARTPAQAAPQVARRQGLRLSPLPARPARSRDRPPHRPARHRNKPAPRPPPLGGCLIATLLVNPFPIALSHH